MNSRYAVAYSNTKFLKEIVSNMGENLSNNFTTYKCQFRQGWGEIKCIPIDTMQYNEISLRCRTHIFV
jgi:hypothetical protein